MQNIKQDNQKPTYNLFMQHLPLFKMIEKLKLISQDIEKHLNAYLKINTYIDEINRQTNIKYDEKLYNELLKILYLLIQILSVPIPKFALQLRQRYINTIIKDYNKLIKNITNYLKTKDVPPDLSQYTINEVMENFNNIFSLINKIEKQTGKTHIVSPRNTNKLINTIQYLSYLFANNMDINEENIKKAMQNVQHAIQQQETAKENIQPKTTETMSITSTTQTINATENKENTNATQTQTTQTTDIKDNNIKSKKTYKKYRKVRFGSNKDKQNNSNENNQKEESNTITINNSEIQKKIDNVFLNAMNQIYENQNQKLSKRLK